jgi:lipopolysaccharide/colanic/teichoic acid biosynthesis glycosyltransferase
MLRRTGLDELPQIVNVLLGDMSFVGPRPDLLHHAERYTREQRRRLEVRPGITGWAQVAGRNDLSWEERIALDIEYLQDWSLRRDIAVVTKTAAVLLSGKGAALPKPVEEVACDEDQQTS